jgi:hypothetical protein
VSAEQVRVALSRQEMGRITMIAREVSFSLKDNTIDASFRFETEDEARRFVQQYFSFPAENNLVHFQIGNIGFEARFTKADLPKQFPGFLHLYGSFSGATVDIPLEVEWK